LTVAARVVTVVTVVTAVTAFTGGRGIGKPEPTQPVLEGPNSVVTFLARGLEKWTSKVKGAQCPSC
jgi:hypothetical protein